MHSIWRRVRDSNPRKLSLQRFSRPPLSTAQPTLRGLICLQSRKNPTTCNTLNLLNVKFVGYITLIAKSRPIKPNFLLLVLSYFLFDNLWIFSNFSYFWCCKPIDTRRQGSIYAVFLYAKKPCFIAFLTGLLVFLLYILTFCCSSILH